MKKIGLYIFIGIFIGLYSSIWAQPKINQVQSKNQQQTLSSDARKKLTARYIIILNDGYRIKDIIGYDVVGDGSGIIKRKNIKRPLGSKSNLERRLNRLKKRQKKQKDPQKLARIQKRIKRLEKKVKNYKKLKASGQLDYKTKTFTIRFEPNLDEITVVQRLLAHPAIKAASKDIMLKIQSMPNDDYLNDGNGGWKMDPNPNNSYKNRHPINIRNGNKDKSDMVTYYSEIEKLWYLKTIQMDQVWALNNTPNGDGIVVAVIDSGQNLNHEDKPEIWINNDEYGNGKESNGIDDDPYTTDIQQSVYPFVTSYIDDYQGWDYVDKDNVPNDGNGHGTHVAGTIAAAGNNSLGIIGIAPSASIMVLKTLGANGEGSTLSSISAIDYAINQGADIINMSLGSKKRQSVDLNTNALNIIQDKLFTEANNQNIIITIAAGNNRAAHGDSELAGYTIPGEIYDTSLTNAYAPAWFSSEHNNIMTVAATTWGSQAGFKKINSQWQSGHNFNESLANFSNFSTRKANVITVAAPGVRMYSHSHSENNGYVQKQGTSMATPVVAGLAALVLDINDKLSATDVVNLIKNNTDATAGTDLANTDYVGTGRVNAFKIVQAAMNSTIRITGPANGTKTINPKIIISGKAPPNTTLQAQESSQDIDQSFSSDANGNFTQIITLMKDGINNISVRATINGQNIISNSVAITADIYKPIITSPVSASTISTPTFNIIGTTSPNATVKVMRKTNNGDIELAQANATHSGEFTITVQPSFNDYQSTYALFASANVGVGNSLINKTSEVVTLNLTIPDFPPSITGPPTVNVITTPQFTITGKAKGGSQVNILENGQITANGTANGVLSEGFQTFSINVPSPQSIGPIQRSYTASSNLYTLPRQSPPIVLTFDVFKPIISTPITNTTIATPTFNFQGTTAPNSSISILKNGNPFATTTSNNDGNFSKELRYDFDGTNQTFKATANVTVNGQLTEKVSEEIHLAFNVPDLRPIITNPISGTSISSPKATIYGTTAPNTNVMLYKNTSNTPFNTATSDATGNFALSFDTTGLLQETFYVKATVYNHTYSSNKITLDISTDFDSPSILYPEKIHINSAKELNFRGECKFGQTLYLFEQNISQLQESIIATTKCNSLNKWDYKFRTLSDGTYYYSIKTKKSNTQWIGSSPVKITHNNIENFPSIHIPKSATTITEGKFQLSGISAKNTPIKLKAINSSNITQTVSTINSNDKGKWQTTIDTLPNDTYRLYIEESGSNPSRKSNEITLTTNYDFMGTEFKLSSPKNNTKTHLKTVNIEGVSPYGTITIFKNNTPVNQFKAVKKSWSSTINLDSDTDFTIHAIVTHNALVRTSEKINITRNSTPTISSPPETIIKNNKVKLSGNGKENTKLTIVILETSFNFLNGSQVKNIKSKEQVVAEVTTDSNGNWSSDIPIYAPGTYQFLVYENYDEPNQRVSTTYTYDIKSINPETQLNLAPSPFNPLISTLKIEYILSENSNVNLEIFTITGQKVYTKTLTTPEPGTNRGRYIIEWDGRFHGQIISPGLYIIMLKASGSKTEIKTKRLGVKW